MATLHQAVQVMETTKLLDVVALDTWVEVETPETEDDQNRN